MLGGGKPKQTELGVVQNGFLEEVSLGISRQLTSFIKINNPDIGDIAMCPVTPTRTRQIWRHSPVVGPLF